MLCWGYLYQCDTPPCQWTGDLGLSRRPGLGPEWPVFSVCRRKLCSLLLPRSTNYPFSAATHSLRRTPALTEKAIHALHSLGSWGKEVGFKEQGQIPRQVETQHLFPLVLSTGPSESVSECVLSLVHMCKIRDAGTGRECPAVFCRAGPGKDSLENTVAEY